MPYVPFENRVKYATAIDAIVNLLKEDGVSSGDVNYVITRILDCTFEMGNSPSYSKINTIVGILECVKQEFYRRRAADYEDGKIELNGDVYV